MKKFLALTALVAATLVGGAQQASADFIYDTTLVSNNISSVFLLAARDEPTPVDPLPFGADVGFATYLGLANTDDLSQLDATFSILFTDVASGLSTTFQVQATGPIGQNATAVSTFGGPTFVPNLVSFTLGGIEYTLSNFRAAATPGNPKAGTFAFSVTTSAVPEPASMAMLAMGGLGVLGAARRRRKV